MPYRRSADTFSASEYMMYPFTSLLSINTAIRAWIPDCVACCVFTLIANLVLAFILFMMTAGGCVDKRVLIPVFFFAFFSYIISMLIAAAYEYVVFKFNDSKNFSFASLIIYPVCFVVSMLGHAPFFLWNLLYFFSSCGRSGV